jgi:ribose 5-phosphate isomerase RpiB
MKGNEFAPSPLPTEIQNGANAKPIDIVFGPDGGVASITSAISDVPSFPQGQIFLCLGDSDGIRPDNLFTSEKKAPANLVNLESKWIVINPGTGRVVSAPFSSVSSIPAAAVINPYDASLDQAITEARLLANFADTVDIE